MGWELSFRFCALEDCADLEDVAGLDEVDSERGGASFWALRISCRVCSWRWRLEEENLAHQLVDT